MLQAIMRVCVQVLKKISSTPESRFKDHLFCQYSPLRSLQKGQGQKSTKEYICSLADFHYHNKDTHSSPADQSLGSVSTDKGPTPQKDLGLQNLKAKPGPSVIQVPYRPKGGYIVDPELEPKRGRAGPFTNRGALLFGRKSNVLDGLNVRNNPELLFVSQSVSQSSEEHRFSPGWGVFTKRDWRDFSVATYMALPCVLNMMHSVMQVFTSFFFNYISLSYHIIFSSQITTSEFLCKSSFSFFWIISLCVKCLQCRLHLQKMPLF